MKDMWIYWFKKTYQTIMDGGMALKENNKIFIGT